MKENITDIMQKAYIDYSMSVIVSRALPDVRDGFKPVQRRVLYAMLREGLLHNRAYDKCAGVVGEVLKNYHPHGDSSVYDTLVRMAQPWVMRYPLVDGQGNFGSVDGDSAAAYRYTECKLTKLSEELLKDIDEDTVDFAPNYKESSTEPTVLPSALPSLLMNGSTGIAVGMATNIPPHNLGELIDAVCAVIDNPAIEIDEIMQILPGPDFPTGGSISGKSGIESYMKTGRGIVRMRGTIEIEELSTGRQQLVITHIPYNVNRATLVTRIADLVKEKILDGVSDLRDESTEQTRIVVELKMGEIERVTINKLFKLTALESSFGVILLALDRLRPRQLNIKEAIQCYVEHRREVTLRRTNYRLRKAEDRAHILEGFKIALDNLDEFVRIIRASQNRNDAKDKLIDKYSLSDRQAGAILDLRLYQLTGMEREKIENEYLELMKIISDLKNIIDNEGVLLDLIKSEINELKNIYSDSRKCEILDFEGDVRMEDLIPNDGCVITVTKTGFIKRISVEEFKVQNRGGKGVIGSGQREEDPIDVIQTCNAHDTLMFIMNNGRVYVEKAYEIPEASRTSKGRNIINLLNMQKDEKIATVLTVNSFESDDSIVLCTKHGIVKKSLISQYKNHRKGGIIGIKIDEGDSVLRAMLAKPDDHLLILTNRGKGLRFACDQLRDQGRATRGVRGIRLKPKDLVVNMLVVDDTRLLLICGSNGLGIRTKFSSFLPNGGNIDGIEDTSPRKRGGQGVTAMNTDSVCDALSVCQDSEILMLSKKGQAVRCNVTNIRETNRGSKGVKLIGLNDKDSLVGVSEVVMLDEGNDDLSDEIEQESVIIESAQK
ncbi:MAG: DNA gyrase subunit A [Verrucomicrobia bacterium]|jgi:DNA gyrase subunit A|nr:DNA gyrase subunit A [Verrucomicrobiota bacterium]MDA1077545.1 DNA gyrase subunit A [Verrucomicrobiota bacterium]